MKRGFTLIELLIVIAIVAVLAVAVVLVLNPAELIKQGRDATRISDFGTISSAIGYAIVTATSSPIFTGAGAARSTFSTTCPFGICTISTRATDGTGWVAVNLSWAQGGSPIGALPVDPLNNSTSSQYSAKTDTTAQVFELDTILESAKYMGQMANDGGNDNGIYEAGTKLNL